MHYVRNTIMLIVNGLFMVAYAGFIDFFIKKFDITTLASEVIIIIGSVIIFLPLLFKLDVFVKKSSWQTTFLIFWKETHYKDEMVKQISILGIIPIYEDVVGSTHSITRPEINDLTSEMVEIALAFIPVANSYISLGRNIKRLR